MNSRPVISNASPLIPLTQLGRLDFLHRIYPAIVIPPAVATEIEPTVPLPDWIQIQGLSRPVDPRILRAPLGPGESETISLALESNARLVILDERAGRSLARSLRLPIIGTLGFLLACKRRGLLPAIKPCLDMLVEFGFRVSIDLYENVLRDAGEVHDPT